MPNPVADALEGMESGEGLEPVPEESEAEFPLLDEDGAADRDGDELEGEESGGLLDVDLYEWVQRVPEGSHLEFDADEWWDTENGGRNRLAFHLSDAAGSGAGYPNGVGLLVGVLEEYFTTIKQRKKDADGDSGTDSDDGGAPGGELY